MNNRGGGSRGGGDGRNHLHKDNNFSHGNSSSHHGHHRERNNDGPHRYNYDNNFDGNNPRYEKVGSQQRQNHHHHHQQQQQQEQYLKNKIHNHGKGGDSGQKKRSRSPSVPTHPNDSQHYRRPFFDSPNKNYSSSVSYNGTNNNSNIHNNKEGGDVNNGSRIASTSSSSSSSFSNPHPVIPVISSSSSLSSSAKLPPDKRRTLILSNIPSDIQYYHLMNFFWNNWNAPVQYCVIDRFASEAYVVFKSTQDAQRVWNNGQGNNNNRGGGLDGKSSSTIASHEGIVKDLDNTHQCVHSLVMLGIELKAIHFTNHVVVVDSETTTERMGGDHQREDCIGDYYACNRERNVVGNDLGRMNDECSYHNSALQDSFDPGKKTQYDQTHQSHVSPVLTSIQSTPTNNNISQNYTPIPSSCEQREIIHNSSAEVQIQKQKMAEEEEEEKEWAKWEAFQNLEMEWRKRRHYEYTTFIEAKKSRLAQLVTLEQKRDLLSKQEEMLSRQLPLHKKMLVMLQSKNASPSEQSSKMKEILSTSKRIVELKIELKSLFEDIEKIKDEESIRGVFRPSEKRPKYFGVGGQKGSEMKRSLDRRTTVLKVCGFDAVSNCADEDAITKRFSVYGTITSVRLEEQKTDEAGIDHNQTSTLIAFITFENRIDAEKAKFEISKLDRSLTCTWYTNVSPSPASETKNGCHSPIAIGHDSVEVDEGSLYDDIYEDADQDIPYQDSGHDFDDNYDDEEENFVDYD